MKANKPNYVVVAVIAIAIAFSAAMTGTAGAYQFGNIDVKVRASAAERYDSNITYASSSVKQDYISTFAGGLDATYEGRLNSMNFTANVNQDIFAMNPKFTNTSEDFAFTYLQELTKLDRFSIRDAFDHTYQPRNFEDTLGRTSGIYSSVRNKLNIDYTRDLSKQLSATLKYFGEIDLFSEPDMSDSYLNQGGAELTYAFTSNTILYATYDFYIRSFVNGSSATTNNAGGGIRQFITKQLYVDASGGVSFVDSYDSTKYTQPFVYVTITDDINDKTTVKGNFKKEYYASQYEQNIFDYWEISGSVTSQLLKRLTGSLDAFYGRGEYLSIDTTDNLFGLNAGADYQLTKKLILNASYNFSRTDSNVDTNDYTKNVVTVAIRGVF